VLCLRHGASACWTEMFYSQRIIEDETYLPSVLQSCAEDRPLVVQVCGNDPATMAMAAVKIEEYCNSSLHGLDAIDVNLGCPQKRAKEGHYGSYLLDRRDWELVESIVTAMASSAKVPISCKIRLLQTQAQTLEFARRLQRAGASLITVHGRQRGSQRHGRRGPADLHQVAAVKEALKIPVVANGNIRCPRDALRNLELTGADGVMSAEGILANPVLFQEARELAGGCDRGEAAGAAPWREDEDKDGMLSTAPSTCSVAGAAACAMAVGSGEAGDEACGEGGGERHRQLMLDAALEYLQLAEECKVPFDTQSQHVSHLLGLSAATQRVGWLQRVSAAQGAKRGGEGAAGAGRVQGCAGSGVGAGEARELAHELQPHEAKARHEGEGDSARPEGVGEGDPVAPAPCRMKRMKEMVNGASCSADLGALVALFLGRVSPSRADDAATQAPSAHAHVRCAAPADDRGRREGVVLGLDGEEGGGCGHSEVGGEGYQVQSSSSSSLAVQWDAVLMF
jgi:tRNA-dihydrouridine synthase 1